MTMAPRDGVVDLWAMAAELERQFAGYKERFPERSSSCCVDDDDDGIVDAGDGDSRVELVGGVSNGRVEADEAAEENIAGDGDGGDGGGGVRGRMYEAYTRRRNERLRSVWRARMERKEAEVMALWARLRGGGPAAAAADDDGCTAGEEAEEDGEKRRSSDVAAPGRVSGKKHARTRRSFSSANLVKSSRPDVGLRRALSQEPLPPEPPAGAAVVSRARAVTVGGAAPKRKAVSGSKGSVKEQGSVRQAGTKPPRGVTRRSGSGGMEAVVLPNADGVVALAPRPSCSSEPAVASDREDEAQKASSSPRLLVGSDNDNCTGTENARAASPESGCGSEVVDGAAADSDGAEAKKNDVVQERDFEEEVAAQSPEAEAKLGNGEVTSDSEIELSYVLIKKKAVEAEAARLSDTLGAGSDADPHQDGNAVQATTAADADMITAEIATTANTEESSDELSSFSGTGRSGRDSAPHSPPSCSSQAQSIERLLQEDAALLRKKREDQSARGRRSAQAVVSTPPSARSRGAARTTTSPRGTAMGLKKRFLSFGKKNRGRDGGATVIDCTSPASPADCGRARRCRTADDAIRPRAVGSSSDAAASDGTEHGYAAATPHACSLQSLVAASPAKSELSEIVPREKSPKSHRSFFSFRSFNCGRG